MATPVEMPKLGNTVEQCLLVAWHKRKGDAVRAGRRSGRDGDRQSHL